MYQPYSNGVPLQTCSDKATKKERKNWNREIGASKKKKKKHLEAPKQGEVKLTGFLIISGTIYGIRQLDIPMEEMQQFQVPFLFLLLKILEMT